MGFRFRRSIKLLPGLRVGVTSKGASLRVGPPGLGYTVNSKGQKRISAGIPGTGLHWGQSLNPKPKRRSKQAHAPETLELSRGVDHQHADAHRPSRFGQVILWGFASFGALSAFAILFR